LILNSSRALEQKYSKKIVVKDGHQFNVSTRGSNHGVYDWFPMVQRFTRSFLVEIFKNGELRASQVILDPFMGSGNTLIACREFDKIGYGIDVSPLFWFVAHVKTNHYSYSDFDEAIEAIDEAGRETEKDIQIPALSSYKRLFNRKRLSKLLMLKKVANSLKPKTKELMLFALASELVHFSRATRYGKGLRNEKRKKLTSVDKVLKLKLSRMKEDYGALNGNETLEHKRLFPLLGDARDLSFIKNPLTGRKVSLPRGEIDCVVTSPPYCNSADYVEMYKLEHWFLDYVKSYDEFKKLSYSTLRSHTTLNNENIEWKHNAIEDICDFLENSELLWNRKIPTMIRAYFDDLHKCLGELKDVLRPNGVIFLLVANSSYGTVPVPTDLLVAEAADDMGIEVEKIIEARLLTTSGQQWKNMDNRSRKLLRESVLVLRA
jgi:site-specific DNA-methyltransferase (adenine-specific)